LSSSTYSTWLVETLYTLSIGEARRLAMALAYIASPKLLLFDESLLGLDKSSEELLTELIEGVERVWLCYYSFSQ